MRYTRVLASAALALGLAQAAVAAPAVMLNHALITQIPKADQPSFHQAVADALNNSADGQSTNWSSVPKRKVTPPITVKLTPTQTTKLRTIAPAASWKAISRGPTPPSPGSSGSASSPTAAGRPAATKAGRAARASRGTGRE